MVLLTTFKASCMFEDTICHIYSQYLCLLKNNPCLLVVHDLRRLRQAAAKNYFCLEKLTSIVQHLRCLHLETAAEQTNKKTYRLILLKLRQQKNLGIRIRSHGGFVICAKRSLKFLQRPRETCSEDFSMQALGDCWLIGTADANTTVL